MLGTDSTWIRASGRLVERNAIVLRNDVSKAAVVVIPASLDAPTSLAPMRIVTSPGFGLRAAAFCAWASVPPTFAPVTASLPPLGGLLAPQFMAGLRALIRRHTELTEVLVPVDHE